MTSYLRYKQELRTVQDADDIESWITVRGNHIPIKKGQSKEDAVKSFIESKGGEYKKESYGKHYVKYGEGENKRYASPRNDLIYSEKSRAGFFGSEKEAKEYAEKLNHKDPYAGTEFAMKNYKRTVLPYEVESEPESKPETKKTEFESVFGNSSWNAHKDWASYVDNDYRIEVIKENDRYYISKFDIDDYDGSDPEMEEYADTIEEAKKVAEKMINKSQPMSKEQKMDKVNEARSIIGGSVRFEKEGKDFVITGYYTGKEVKFDFEKLTGHSPNESVQYRMDGDKLIINSYYGRWVKEIDFSKIDDKDLAEMIKG